MSEAILDAILVGAVVVTAFRALHAPTLFASVVMYVGFGLLLSIVWIRLHAPDLALAEAAIGAGVTGAMLLDTARQMGEAPESRSQTRNSTVYAATAGLVILFVGIGWIFITLPRSPSHGLTTVVSGAMPLTGVDHPVTAVLLDFRGYDTLLEMGVLLVASIGMLVLARADTVGASEVGIKVNPVARGAASLIVPVGTLVGAYLLWRGTHGPGGAFPAGAILGALGVMLTLIHRSPLSDLRPLALRTTLVLALLTFLLIGSLPVLGGAAFMDYPADAGAMILIIEIAVTLSVAATLVVLFRGGRHSVGMEGGDR